MATSPTNNKPANVSFETYIKIAESSDQELENDERLGGVDGIWTEKASDSERSSPEDLVSPWPQRITAWKQALEEGSNWGQSYQACDDLQQLNFGAFFLEHPVAAMSLWNLLQNLYKLDLLVCGEDDTSRRTLDQWKEMKPFKYLTADSVEKKWRTSIKALNGLYQRAIKNNALDPSMETHMRKLLHGTENLERALQALEERFSEALVDSPARSSMLDMIRLAIKTKLDMFAEHLKIVENDDKIDSLPRNVQNKKGESHGKYMVEKEEYDPRIFQPLTRRKTSEIAKRYFIFAFTETKAGKATFEAVIVVIILIMCLIMIQMLLLNFQEIGHA